MYYDTPNLTSHIRFVKRHRLAIIVGYFLLAITALFFFHPQPVSSDRLLWLEESQEFQRTVSHEYSASYISRIEVRPPTFDEPNKQILLALQKRLESVESVQKVDSLFTAHYIYANRDGEDSSMVRAQPISQIDAAVIPKLIRPDNPPYSSYVDTTYSRFSFYVYSSSPLSLETVSIPFEHEIASISDEPHSFESLLIALGIAAIFITLIFRFIFKNTIAVVAVFTVVAFNIIGTFTAIWLITGINQLYLALLLLVSGVALIDFLYFYYRWHVSHYRADNDRALLKSMNRNITPAFWTSVITLLGLGSLLWVDSAIINLLCLSLIFASLFAYLFNITLLPALLSYFRVDHPKIDVGRLGYLFAKNEIHYKPTYLLLFLTATAIVAAIGAYTLTANPERLFAHSVNEHTIVVKVPYSQIDLETVRTLRAFESDLHSAHPEVGEIDSVVTVLSMLNKANSGSAACSDQDLIQALFFLELYNLEERYFDETALNVTIHLGSSDKSALIKWLQSYDKLDLYFADFDTLISSAKMDKILLLGISLVSVLVLIGLIMGRIFRQTHLIWVGFIANAIPIIWFGLFIELAHIPLSLEVLIAMMLSVGLSSDATVHFAFKYFRSRYFGRSRRHSLEVMFFYAGIPVLIGTLILSTVFGLLAMTSIYSLQLIGGFGAGLILLSLLTDLFILPVLLLSIDPFGKKNTTEQDDKPQPIQAIIR